MNSDIASILDEWPFDPNSNVRHIHTADGREKIQVRIEQGPFRGILQMDLEGRPDGTRPHDCDYAFDYYVKEQQLAAREGLPPEEFSLDREACKELFAESKCIYERYAFLLQLADFPRVIRDTERNMRMFSFVNRHAAHADDRDNLERWWPYVIRINGTARAMLALREVSARRALEVVDEVRQQIKELRTVDAVEWRIEVERSEEALDELQEELENQVEPTLPERLQRELDNAVESEDFEAAALIRDRLLELEAEAVVHDDDPTDDV